MKRRINYYNNIKEHLKLELLEILIINQKVQLYNDYMDCERNENIFNFVA